MNDNKESKVAEMWYKFVESEAFIQVSTAAIALPVISALVLWGVPTINDWLGW